MSAVKQNSNISAMAARTAAVRKLIASHQDEFDTLLGDEREKIGLARNPHQDAIQRKIKDLEAKLAKARAELT